MTDPLMGQVPDPVVQDHAPDGAWIPERLEHGLARAHWQPGASPEPTARLRSQDHDHGRWKAGAGSFLTWHPADPPPDTDDAPVATKEFSP